MKRITVDPHRPRSEDVSRAAEVLARGGIVAYPTETFYGLAVDAMDRDACARLFSLKGRDSNKAMPCILGSVQQLELVTEELSPLVRRLAMRFWPGPLTLVVPARPEVAARAANGTVAVRVSGLGLARQLAEALGGPITATSANRAGAAPSVTADDVVRAFQEDVDLVLDGGATPGGLASTIVDVTRDPPALVRRGAVDYVLVVEALHA